MIDKEDIFFRGLEPSIKELREREEKRQAVKSEVLSSDIRSIFQTLLSYVGPDELFNIIVMSGYNLLISENLQSLQVSRGPKGSLLLGMRENGEIINYSPYFI